MNSFPYAPEYLIGAIWKFNENSWIYSHQLCGVVDTGDKLFTGANDSGDKLSLLSLVITTDNVVDTGEYALSMIFIDSDNGD
jgi:hypothetical protein